LSDFCLELEKQSKGVVLRSVQVPNGVFGVGNR